MSHEPSNPPEEDAAGAAPAGAAPIAPPAEAAERPEPALDAGVTSGFSPTTVTEPELPPSAAPPVPDSHPEAAAPDHQQTVAGPPLEAYAPAAAGPTPSLSPTESDAWAAETASGLDPGVSRTWEHEADTAAPNELGAGDLPPAQPELAAGAAASPFLVLPSVYVAEGSSEAMGRAESALSPEESAARLRGEPERHLDGSANWMLAFVCAWAGATSLYEAWILAAPGGFRGPVLRTPGFLGYALLGAGLLLFALDALQWGKRRRGPVLFLTVVAILVTVGGVLGLLMSSDPGRRI